MNLASRISLSAGLFSLAFAPLVKAQAPYLETRPLTIDWNFVVTGIKGTTIGSKPRPVDREGNPLGIDDPEKLNPVDRATTEKGLHITYSKGDGDQGFIVKHLLQAVAENAAQGITTDELEKGRWELTAVREPQETVLGAATTPYTIYLTRIQATEKGGRISKTYLTTDLEVGTVGNVSVEANAKVYNGVSVPTGLFLTFDHFTGAYNETLADGRVTKATGNIAVAFTIGFNSVFASDPRYKAQPTTETDELGNEIIIPPQLGVDFHSMPNHWSALGTGMMTAGIRSTPGPLAAVVPTKIQMTAVGSWSHLGFDFPALTNYDIEQAESFSDLAKDNYGGIAPLKIKIGEAKFQRRELFIQND